MAEEIRRLSPFAVFIRARRLQLRLSQEQVARLAGPEFSGGYVAKLERDAVDTPSVARVRKLATALQTPSADLGRLLFGEDGDAAASLPAPPSPPTPVIDPALPAYIQEALRPLVGHVPDEDVRAVGRLLAGLALRSREELEARNGPLAGTDAAHDGTAG